MVQGDASIANFHGLIFRLNSRARKWPFLLTFVFVWKSRRYCWLTTLSGREQPRTTRKPSFSGATHPLTEHIDRPGGNKIVKFRVGQQYLRNCWTLPMNRKGQEGILGNRGVVTQCGVTLGVSCASVGPHAVVRPPYIGCSVLRTVFTAQTTDRTN